MTLLSLPGWYLRKKLPKRQHEWRRRSTSWTDICDQTQCLNEMLGKASTSTQVCECHCDQGHPVGWGAPWGRKGTSPQIHHKSSGLLRLFCVSAHRSSNRENKHKFPQTTTAQDKADGAEACSRRWLFPSPTAHLTHLLGTAAQIVPVCNQRFAKQNLKYQCNGLCFSVSMLNTTLQGVGPLEV